MKPGKNIRPVSRLEVIGTLAGAGIEALGFASIPLTEKLGLSEPLRVGICLFLVLIGVVVILFTSFVGQGKAFPLKKPDGSGKPRNGGRFPCWGSNRNSSGK